MSNSGEEVLAALRFPHGVFGVVPVIGFHSVQQRIVSLPMIAIIRQL